MEKTLGTRIAEARRNAGLTQEQVAEKLGVSFQAVSSWERDEYSPETERLVKLSQVLGISLTYLAAGGDSGLDAKREIFDWEHQKTFVKVTAKRLGLTDTLKALDFAENAHRGQKRKNSDIPYIAHPLTVACHCLAMGISEDAVIAACLLHDVIEDCGVTENDLPVGDDARRLVVLLTKGDENGDRDAMLREYFGGIASDPRAALIKCLDRCNNLTTMTWGLTRERQLRAVRETETYVLPLLQTVKDVPGYNDAAWLLRYQIESMLDVYKRLL